MKTILMLEDGTVFEGISAELSGENIGEVILNTAVTGYQEIITDPANAGKIVVFTYPLIGNCGAADQFNESADSRTAGIVIREKSGMASNWQARETFDDFLKKKGIPALDKVDTRTLAVKIRDKGEMLGIIARAEAKKQDLLDALNEHKNGMKKDFIKRLSVKKPGQIKGGPSGPAIAILDLGVTNSLLAQLKALECSITILPYNTASEEILAAAGGGLIISGGPEDDIAVPAIAGEIKKVIGKVPVLGISLGHQVIALALGGRLKKVKMGHRGSNYPVRSADSFKGEITVQNHGFTADADSLKGVEGLRITLSNLNDDTVEEMESAPLKLISVQYCPVRPGYGEVNEVLKRFLKFKKNKKQGGRKCQNAQI